ncbi:MAG: hypothetical protein BWX82_00108 [Parcubacteria group bacterium ADurb.Bin115]|nr:MAG: hypothetical protein BWX82_00108 [Parcubacteria group bacterium ADurb.Bin115]
MSVFSLFTIIITDFIHGNLYQERLNAVAMIVYQYFWRSMLVIKSLS